MGCTSNWRSIPLSIPFLIPLPAAGSGLSWSHFMFPAVSWVSTRDAEELAYRAPSSWDNTGQNHTVTTCTGLYQCQNTQTCNYFLQLLKCSDFQSISFRLQEFYCTKSIINNKNNNNNITKISDPILAVNALLYNTCSVCFTQYSPWSLDHSGARFFKHFKCSKQDLLCDPFLLALETCQMKQTMINLLKYWVFKDKLIHKYGPTCQAVIVLHSFTLRSLKVTYITFKTSVPAAQ